MNGTLQFTTAASPDGGAATAWPLLRPAIPPSQHACCCPARPLFQAVMPATRSAHVPVEVLLCGHHYRRSQATLRGMGSAIYDETGYLVAQPV
jgi:hypothetical protein